MTGGQGEGRRFLLTGVVSRYHHDPSWDRAELSADLDAMTGLFTRELGYEHVPVMGLDPTRLQIQEALRDFSTTPDRQPEDYVVLYLAGHGEVLQASAAGPEHVLLPADAVPSDLRRRAVKSADLAEWLLAETRVRRLLVLIDTCFSGQGGVDFARNAAAWAGSAARFDTPDESGVVVVSATWPRQEALPGAFTGGFVRAVRDPATAGHVPGGLAVDAVVGVMNADPAVPTSQDAQWNLVLGTGKMPGFLQNPRRDVSLVDLDLAEQARRWQWRQDQEDRRAEEMRGQFVPRIAGFIGRSRALTDISRWLGDPADTRPRIVTGDPGSGKTAVLGLLAALSDPRRRPTVPRDGLPAGIIPSENMIDVAIYAGNLSSSQVLTALAAAAELDDIDPDPAALDLGIVRLIGLRGRDRPLVAVIDALDEAADPVHLAGRLLRPLIERGQGHVRLLLGTRRHVCQHLGPAWSRDHSEVDLDTPRYADPQSLAALVRRILRTGDPAQASVSPFASSPPAVLEEVTSAIADAAGLSFFVARILASTQAAQPRLPEPHDPAWRAGLPSRAGPAMRQDLETRLPGQASRAIDLLRPLAYAQGPGLPWEDIWPLLANTLAPGHEYTNDDLLDLTERAGSYIVESGTIQDRSLYRLYHRSLAEYLRSDRDQHADETAITRALVSHIPLRANGRADWASTHPYIGTFLPDHATACGMIDDLAQDPGFLLSADPPHLLAALDATSSDAARTAADAYRRARPSLRRHPAAEHAACLALAARCGRGGAVADRVIADGLDIPWRPLWASWQVQRPHAVIPGHRGYVYAVAVAELAGSPVVISGGSDEMVRVWDLATGTPHGSPFTGHGDWVRTVTAAELAGSPVVISGGDDGTVRVWDLATGTPHGDPFTGHRGNVYAVAVTELDGSPVVISGGDDGTVRVWDLATGTPCGSPFTGHTGSVYAVAVAELDGSPVVISGSSDETVRVWDLATGTPHGDPFTGHRGNVYAVAVAELAGSPVAISGSGDGTVRVWDLATGTPHGDPFTGHGGSVNAVAVTELDGSPVVISGSSDETVRVWDLATGTPHGDPFTGHGDWVRSVAAAELEGRPVVISGSSDGTVRVWDLAAKAHVSDPFTGHIDWVRSVAAAELDGRPVAISGGDDYTVRVWDLAAGTYVSDPFTGHRGSVNAVAVAELDGSPVVISGSGDGTVRVWDLATGTPCGDPFTGHGGSVNAVAVAELDGSPVVISGSGDGTVRVWDLATGTPCGDPFTGHTGSVYAVAVAELDGSPVVISGSGDGTVRVWDLATGTPCGSPFTGHGGSVNAVAVAELDGSPVVISGGDDGTVRVWDLATGTPCGSPFTGHTGSVYAVAVAELDGSPVVISGGDDGTVRVWDLATGTPCGDPFTGHTGSVYAVAVAELDGSPVVISGSSDETVRVWDLATGTPHGSPFTGHRGYVNAVAVAELDGSPVVISGSSDGTVRVWDLATGTPHGSPFTGHGDWVRSVAAAELAGSPVVISGGDDGTVRVWDLATGTPHGDPFTGHRGNVYAVAVAELAGSPVAISGSGDGTVRVWDLATGTPHGDPFTGHRGSVYAVAVTELDGSPVVISGSSDETVRVWDLATGTPHGDPFTGHTGSVNAVAVAELDGNPVVISGSDDGTVRVWDLATGDTVVDPPPEAPAMVTSISAPATGGTDKSRTMGRQTSAVICAGDSAIFCDSGTQDTRAMTLVMPIHTGSRVLAAAWHPPAALVIGTESGIVVIEIASQ